MGAYLQFLGEPERAGEARRADSASYSKLEENCTKSTVYGRKNENLCHLTVRTLDAKKCILDALKVSVFNLVDELLLQ